MTSVLSFSEYAIEVQNRQSVGAGGRVEQLVPVEKTQGAENESTKSVNVAKLRKTGT